MAISEENLKAPAQQASMEERVERLKRMQEANLRSAAAQQDVSYATAQGTDAGRADFGLLARRPSLLERVAGQAQSARYSANKAERLEELTYLLQKHPDVARILDLIDEVRE